MRIAREKMIGKDCYYHCCARIAGDKNNYLFTDVDKEKAMKIVYEESELFFLEVISMCWMDNHWHIIVFAPDELPKLDDVVKQYNSYHKKKKIKTLLSLETNPNKVKLEAKRLIDISYFMSRIHQKFTWHINNVHNRRGTLWAERFKSSILEGEEALWNCVKYVELNPVRAKMIENPADYRFSTWGIYSGKGKHPFLKNFIKHMKKSLGEIGKDWTPKEVIAEFRGELARTIAYESGKLGDEICKAKEKAKKGDNFQIEFLRKTKYWTNGAIIGTESFVQEVALQFHDKKRVIKKKLKSTIDFKGNILHCYKRLNL